MASQVSNYLNETVPTKPIHEKSYREYYQNGNVKAYVCVFNTYNPNFEEKVRNKDIYLYSENYDRMFRYIELNYYTEWYRLKLKEFIAHFSSYHSSNKFSSDFLYEDLLSKEAVSQQKNQSLTPFPNYQDIRIFHQKLANIYFKRWFKKNKFCLINSLRKRLSYDFDDALAKQKTDLKQRLDTYHHDLTQYATSHYDSLFRKAVDAEKQAKVKEILNTIRTQYVQWGDEASIKDYFEYTVANVKSENRFFSKESLCFQIDKESHTIIVNLSLPEPEKFPKVESFRTIKKDVIATPTLFNTKKIYDYLSEFAISYIIHLAKALDYVDDYNYLNYFVFNLYNDNQCDKNHCFKVITLNKSELNFSIKEATSMSLFKESFGSTVDYALFHGVEAPFGVKL